MSQQTSSRGGQAIAQIVSGLTSQVVLGAAETMPEAVLVGMSATAPALMIVAGLISKKFYDATERPAPHPGSCATENSILFAALMIARATSPADGGCGLQMSPELFADTIADFAKLAPLVSVDTVIRPDLLTAARDTGGTDVGALVSGILAKKPPTDSVN